MSESIDLGAVIPKVWVDEITKQVARIPISHALLHPQYDPVEAAAQALEAAKARAAVRDRAETRGFSADEAILNLVEDVEALDPDEWSEAFKEHVAQPYCECRFDPGGGICQEAPYIELCTHARDLGIKP